MSAASKSGSEERGATPEKNGVRHGHGFGTLPVFLAAISTILGAVMFLRFGYAVGHLGLLGAIGVIALGHVVTIPTALALSEIATNRRVEGGGEYFLISRSFGGRIGASIGLSLYLSQAISVAFYCIAFAEAFRPVIPNFEALTGLVFDPRMVSLPTVVVLIVVMLTKGAALGVRVLYAVVAVLAASLTLFFAGGPVEAADGALRWNATVSEPDSFFMVFAICFPAFTGMTAGVGLSGDLARPSRSIPLGTLLGTLCGLVVYIALVIKLAISAPPELLAGEPLVMAKVALWGPMIPIGLACATLSSAIGSILVAPRTLQALGKDEAFPAARMNRFLRWGVGEANEPRASTLVTGALAIVFVATGDVDAVARLISMFFMVTYGALCAASFLEHFAASPGYRPSFRSRWYVSLIGSVMCLGLMFQMDPVFAALSILAMSVFYGLTRLTPAGGAGRGVAELLRGVMSQLTRRLHVHLQRTRAHGPEQWRPSMIMISERTFTGSDSPLLLLGWLSANQGFGTYFHFVRGFLNAETGAQRQELKSRLVDLRRKELKGVYVDVMVSPSMRSAAAQTLQVPGVSGLENNSLVLEYRLDDHEEALAEVAEDALFALDVRKSAFLFRHGPRRFGQRRTIHIWLTWDDEPHAAMMVMLAYVLLGGDAWHQAEVHVFAALPTDRIDEQRDAFLQMINEGRLPISVRNVRFMPVDSFEAFRGVVDETSADADLVIRALSRQTLADQGADALRRHPELSDVLWVSSAEAIEIE